MKLHAMKASNTLLTFLLLLGLFLALTPKAQAMAQITMVNRSQLVLNLYISDNGQDFYFGCGPVLGLGHFTNSPGQFCTSSITPGIHWLQARDGDKVVMHEDNVNIGDGTTPTWTVTIAADPDEELIKRLDGARYYSRSDNYAGQQIQLRLEIRGTTLILSSRITGKWNENLVIQIVGRVARSRENGNDLVYTISEDGASIINEDRLRGGTILYTRQ